MPGNLSSSTLDESPSVLHSGGDPLTTPTLDPLRAIHLYGIAKLRTRAALRVLEGLSDMNCTPGSIQGGLNVVASRLEEALESIQALREASLIAQDIEERTSG
jgi:hypothetical protein